jgi:hypothetical protein
MVRHVSVQLVPVLDTAVIIFFPAFSPIHLARK